MRPLYKLRHLIAYFGMRIESIRNNYAQHININPLAHDDSRVYHSWRYLLQL